MANKNMIKNRLIVVLLCLLPFSIQAGETMQQFYSYKATDINGIEHSMSEYKGKVVLVVNVASKCGFTPQYEGLEKLYEKYRAKGFEILAFPSNEFREQEPGTSKEIQNFCTVNYGVTFPLFEKIKVNSEHAHPLYVFLKKEAPGFLGSQSIKWNFTKFLIDAKGKVVERYGSTTTPASIDKDIQTLLNAS